MNNSTGFTRVFARIQSIYTASKGAVKTHTLVSAPQFAQKGVIVNGVRPGFTAIDMNKEQGNALHP